jgi:arylamine N-acetyltransferase
MSAPAGLDALGLTARSPDRSFLGELFRAFNARIPFESASKIVRDRSVEAIAEKPRRPDVFWGDFRELGAGGTCFARVAAFEALLRELGFSARILLGAIRAPRSHAALLVELGGLEWLVDVGYPLPDVVELVPSELETRRGLIRLTRFGDSAALVFASGPEAGRKILFNLGLISPECFEDAWRATFTPNSIFLAGPILRREIDGRIVRFQGGEVQVQDAGSRARVPLREQRSRKLAEIFDMDEGLLSRALEWTGDPDPAEKTARIEVFREGEDSQPLLDLLATPDGYSRFARGLGAVEVRSTGTHSFEARITPEQGDPAVESIRFDPGTRLLTIDREFGLRRERRATPRRGA